MIFKTQEFFASIENELGRYTDYSGYIRIPILCLSPHVLPKEDMSLDLLQQFLLDAVAMGCSTEDIATATNLTLPTIETELLHLEKQDLLQKKPDGYIQGEVSRRLLLIKRCAERINTAPCSIIVNCMDKSTIPPEHCSILMGDFAIECRSKYTAEDISLEDETVRQFFIEWLRTEEKISDADRNCIVESLYVDEWKEKEAPSFITEHIKRLPCYSNIKPVFNGKETTRAKGMLIALSYTFGDAAYSVYFDTVSGRHIFETPSDAEEAKEFSIELPKLHTLSPEEENRLITELKTRYGLGEIKLEKKEVSEMEYYVDFPLSELFGEEP